MCCSLFRCFITQLLAWNGLALFSIFCWLYLYISYIDFRLSLRIVHFRSSDLCHNNTSFHEVPQVSMTSFLDVFVWSTRTLEFCEGSGMAQYWVKAPVSLRFDPGSFTGSGVKCFEGFFPPGSLIFLVETVNKESHHMECPLLNFY